MWWPWHMTNWEWGGILVGGILMLLFWGSVIALGFFVVRALVRSDRNKERTDNTRKQQTPLDIVKERYARGEITQDEYQRIRNDLES